MKIRIRSQKGQGLLETMVLIPIVIMAFLLTLELLLTLQMIFAADSVGYDYLICRNASHIQGSSSLCEQNTLSALHQTYKNKIHWDAKVRSIQFKLTPKLLPSIEWEKKYENH